MEPKPWRIIRPRSQTPEQDAREHEIVERFRNKKVSFKELVSSGDLELVGTMGEYWDWLKAVAELKDEREQRGLSVEEMARCAGLEPRVIQDLEEGQVKGASYTALCQYASALGRYVHVELAKAG